MKSIMLQKFCSVEFSNPINFEYSYFPCVLNFFVIEDIESPMSSRLPPMNSN